MAIASCLGSFEKPAHVQVEGPRPVCAFYIAVE
jgi:hypothetical protein